MPRDQSTPGFEKVVVAVVLAAGESRRMKGQNKLTFPVDGSPMVARVVDALAASLTRAVVVVTGHQPERIRDALAGRQVKLAHNPGYPEGIASSIRTGIAALDEDVDGALLVLGDMPWVGAEVTNRLVEAFRAADQRSIFIPVFGGERGNPVLWGSRHFPELLALRGDVGGRALFDQHSAAIRHVEVQSPGVRLDVDTPEALRELGVTEK